MRTITSTVVFTVGNEVHLNFVSDRGAFHEEIIFTEFNTEGELASSLMNKIQKNFWVGGCHGWRKVYSGADARIQIFEHDFDEVLYVPEVSTGGDDKVKDSER